MDDMDAAKVLCALVFGLNLTLSPGLAALAETITGDTNHSSSEFVVTHLAISHVHGTIPVTAWSGTISTGDVPASVSATLDASAIDTKSADRDSDLKGADWLDVAKYPTIAFKSTNIQAESGGAFKMTGNLTLHGVTKPVTLDGKVEGSVVDQRGRKHVGYSATTTIDRRDFGLNWGKTTPGGALVAANEVAITINAEGVVSK
jgi:polyisoprenoid-binding protein YceI